MKTGDHILNMRTLTPAEQDRYRYTTRAWCSCGNWKSDVNGPTHARILHGTHFDSVLNDARDAEESAHAR